MGEHQRSAARHRREPGGRRGEYKDLATLSLLFGFVVMMFLDATLAAPGV